MTETLLYAAILAPCLIIAIVFHEVAHGLAALALGDPTAREQRRLSLNPLRHIDPVGTLLVPGALALLGGPVFGWAKPVPINARRLNNPRFGMMAVAAAGPGMNLLLALVAAVLLGVVGGLGLGEGTAAAGISATLLTYLHPHQHLPRAVQPPADPALRRFAHRRRTAAAQHGGTMAEAAAGGHVAAGGADRGDVGLPRLCPS